MTKDTVRRAIGVTATTLLLAAAVVFVLRSPQSALSQEPSAGRTAGASSTSRPTGTQSSQPNGGSSTAPSGSSSASADPGAGGSLAIGPGRTEAGIELVGQPQSDGSWDVVEYVLLAQPDTTLPLRRPDLTRIPAFAARQAEISELQATAGDQVAVIDGRPDSGWQVEAAVPTTSFELRYVLTGATVRSVPSKAGRALGALGPIADPGRASTGAAGTSTLVQLVASGSTVQGLQCPLLGGDRQLCETGAAPTVRTRDPLPRRDALALIQFDLPAPS